MSELRSSFASSILETHVSICPGIEEAHLLALSEDVPEELQLAIACKSR